MRTRPRRGQATPVPAIPASSWRGRRFAPAMLRPPVVPQAAFTRRVRTDIGNSGVAQTVIAASGSGQVSVGPQGVGTVWYPKSCTVATQSGAADGSTATGYLNSVTTPPLFQSYAGGGDTQGLAVPQMQPGDLLIILWSGGTPGNWASITVVGDMDALIT